MEYLSKSSIKVCQSSSNWLGETQLNIQRWCSFLHNSDEICGDKNERCQMIKKPLNLSFNKLVYTDSNSYNFIDRNALFDTVKEAILKWSKVDQSTKFKTLSFGRDSTAWWYMRRKMGSNRSQDLAKDMVMNRSFHDYRKHHVLDKINEERRKNLSSTSLVIWNGFESAKIINDIKNMLDYC